MGYTNQTVAQMKEAKALAKEATGNAIANMMKENTGSHPLDSGLIYGYGYEKRVEIDYPNTPDHYIKNGCYFKSTYHHLLDNLTVDEEENANFQKFIKGDLAHQELERKGLLPRETIEEYSLMLAECVEEHTQTTYEDELKAYCKFMGYSPVSAINTYNSQSFLDVDYMQFDIDDKENHNDRELVVIRTHNGCDARGGYSAPVWFTYNENYREDSNLHSTDVGFLACPNNNEHRFDCYGDTWCDGDDGVTAVDIVEDAEGNLLCPYCQGILQA